MKPSLPLAEDDVRADSTGRERMEKTLIQRNDQKKVGEEEEVKPCSSHIVMLIPL